MFNKQIQIMRLAFTCDVYCLPSFLSCENEILKQWHKKCAIYIAINFAYF